MICRLTDEELDAFIAEKVMGWHHCIEKVCSLGHVVTPMDSPWLAPCWKGIYAGHFSDRPPKYTQDLNTCRGAELKLDPLIYGTELSWHMTCPQDLAAEGYSRGEIDIDYEEVLKIAMATPRERCEAIWKAFK